MSDPKNELGLIAMAAWCNVSVEQLPDEARNDPNNYTAQAWARVFDAVAKHMAGDHPTAADMANKYQRDAAWWREEAERLATALQAIADCQLSNPTDYVRVVDLIAVEALTRHACATGAA